MPRKPSFCCRKTKDGWKVEIPTSLSRTGKRERAFFKNRDEAQNFAAKLQAGYEKRLRKVVAIKPTLAEEAVLALEVLKPTGSGLLTAAHAYREQWEARQEGSS